jgi:hypothetical protein
VIDSKGRIQFIVTSAGSATVTVPPDALAADEEEDEPGGAPALLVHAAMPTASRLAAIAVTNHPRR